MREIAEEDYMRVTNRVRITAALEILKSVVSGKAWGVSGPELHAAIATLRHMEQKLFVELDGRVK